MSHVDRNTGRMHEPDTVHGVRFITWKEAVIDQMSRDGGMSQREIFYTFRAMTGIGVSAYDSWLGGDPPDDWAVAAVTHFTITTKGQIPMTIPDDPQADAQIDEVERIAAILFDHTYEGSDEFGRPTEEACHEIARKIVGPGLTMLAAPPRTDAPAIPDPSKPWREMTALEQAVDVLRQRADTACRDLAKTEERFNERISALGLVVAKTDRTVTGRALELDGLHDSVVALGDDMRSRDDKLGKRCDSMNGESSRLRIHVNTNEEASESHRDRIDGRFDRMDTHVDDHDRRIEDNTNRIFDLEKN